MYSDEIKKFRIKKDAVILAIESSCDETAAAIVKNGREILSSEISSSCTEHIRFGGVVPEIASRAHTSAISLTVQRAVDKANIDLKDIDAVAVTYGAGTSGRAACRGKLCEDAGVFAQRSAYPRQPYQRASGCGVFKRQKSSAAVRQSACKRRAYRDYRCGRL